MQYHFVLTLQAPAAGGGFAMATFADVYIPAPGATRADAYKDIRAQIAMSAPELSDGNVIFFSLEPNTL